LRVVVRAAGEAEVGNDPAPGAFEDIVANELRRLDRRAVEAELASKPVRQGVEAVAEVSEDRL